MKFETPKMSISLFAAENVVTNASQGGQTPATTNHDSAYTALTSGSNAVAANNIVEFTFD